MKALVTGATGFIGSEVARQLVADGHDVRVLVRSTSDRSILDGVDVEFATGDVTDGASVRAALDGRDTLFHTAAYFTHWATDPKRYDDVNVLGTRTTMQAALDVGVEKVVYTSTNNTIGASGGPDPVDETAIFNYWDCGDLYTFSKMLAEIEAFKAAARGLPVVIVNPTLVVGANDRKPTSSGQMVIDVASGRLPVYVEGWVNVVDVRDVARGHVLAAEHGEVGERYLLGHRNLTVGEYFRMIADAAGVSPPRLKAPYPMALAVAHGFELASRFTGRHPAATVSEVRIGHLGESYDCTKAITELGLPQTPVEDAIGRAVAWFRERGHLD